MAATQFNWSKIIAAMTDESCVIPTDVTFQIVEKMGAKVKLHEVKAHKMILAMVSPTFQTMFYATNVGDKTANLIKIEKTTGPAFRIMMDAVYNVKTIRAGLEGKSVDEVFDVVNLVERYQIAELMEAARELLANFPVTDDTVLEVAGDAKEYISMFKAEAEQLLGTCAKFLKLKLKDLDGLSKYAAEHEDQAEILATLIARMKDIEPTASTTCANSKKDLCLDREVAKDDEFRPVDSRFLTHRCPILLGVTVSASQMNKDDKELLRKRIETHGGDYSGVLEMDKTTVLVCASPSGDKYMHAKKWNIPCVTSDWVFDSIGKGYCLPYDDYMVERHQGHQ